MKTLLMLVMLMTANYAEPLYGEDMNSEQQTQVLQSTDLPNDVIAYYNGTMQLADDEATDNLLATLSQPPNEEGLKALYFFLFNRAMMASGATLGNVLPLYAMSMVLDEPQYTLNYFIRNRELMEVYCSLLGETFYAPPQNEQAEMYDFQQFQNHLTNEMQPYPQYQTVLAEFYYFIQKRINELRAPHRQR